jgi:hypothetical protein
MKSILFSETGLLHIQRCHIIIHLHYLLWNSRLNISPDILFLTPLTSQGKGFTDLQYALCNLDTPVLFYTALPDLEAAYYTPCR